MHDSVGHSGDTHMSIIGTIPASEGQGAGDGITLRMYFLDHEPPHIHAIKG